MITFFLQVRENKDVSPSPDNFTAPNSVSTHPSTEGLLVGAPGRRPGHSARCQAAQGPTGGEEEGVGRREAGEATLPSPRSEPRPRRTLPRLLKK